MLDRLTRTGALALLGLALAIIVWCFTLGPPPPRQGTMGVTDVELYTRITASVAHGASYYDAATGLQRANGAPLRPFVVVRPPTLAVMQAHLGPGATRAVAAALLLAGALGWAFVLRGRARLTEQFFAVVAILAGGMLLLAPGLLVWHELWAGALLTLALACYGTRGWPLAVLFAAAAIAIRELAFPFVLLTCAFALAERRWRELIIWAGLAGACLIALAFHAHAVEARLLPTDLASPGWSALRGPVAIVDSFYDGTVLRMLPRPLAYCAALLPMLGWAALGGRQGAFAVLFFAGMGLMLALFARQDNYYWAYTIMPGYFAGFALVPRGLRDLVRSATRPLPVQPAGQTAL